ncbi:MAG: hypothetical protein AVDCRST_MAG87-753, partial [uncultured Thermomicrobiales bacterium]
ALGYTRAGGGQDTGLRRGRSAPRCAAGGFSSGLTGGGRVQHGGNGRDRPGAAQWRV